MAFFSKSRFIGLAPVLGYIFPGYNKQNPGYKEQNREKP